MNTHGPFYNYIIYALAMETRTRSSGVSHPDSKSRWKPEVDNYVLLLVDCLWRFSNMKTFGPFLKLFTHLYPAHLMMCWVKLQAALLQGQGNCRSYKSYFLSIYIIILAPTINFWKYFTHMPIRWHGIRTFHLPHC